MFIPYSAFTHFHKHDKLVAPVWVRGRTTKLVRCEACGRNYAYELKRTAYGQKTELDVRILLETGIDAIPCPACGWYQSSMVPEARRQHRRWMRYVGICLTILVIPAAVIGCGINNLSGLTWTGFLPVPWWILGDALICSMAAGIGLMLWRGYLARQHDPNNQHVEARRRHGRSCATLLSEDAENMLTRAAAHHPSIEPPKRVGWVVFWIMVAAVVLMVTGFAVPRWIIRSTVASRFAKNLQSYVALAPASPPKAVPGSRPPQPGAAMGRVKGKMVVVNVTERDIDDLYFGLPDDLRAANPEDVGTVVLLTWGKINISGDRPISTTRCVEYQQSCQLKVFDWESKYEIASGSYVGGLPERDGFWIGTPTGRKPDGAKVLTFLTSLPRQ
jgi:hypothetical protein